MACHKRYTVERFKGMRHEKKWETSVLTRSNSSDYRFLMPYTFFENVSLTKYEPL